MSIVFLLLKIVSECNWGIRGHWKHEMNVSKMCEKKNTKISTILRS